MFDFFFGLALVLFGLPPSGDTISANGFEAQNVYISTDRPSQLTWAIDSTNHNAAFVTSSSYLNDGKVAVPTRMTWDVGAQTVASTVTLTASPISLPILSNIAVLAVLMPKTAYAIPAGVWIDLSLRFGAGPSVITVQAQTVQLNNGAIGVVGIITGTASGTFIDAHFKIYNSQGGANPAAGATWAASGQTFDVGEIWFGSLQEFKLATDPKLALIDPTLMRRSHSNQPWPLFLKPYKQWTFNFTPMSNTAAYNSASTPSFDSVRYSLAAANCALVLPRIYTPGTTTINSTDLNQLACFGKPESVGELASVQNANTTGLWRASMVFGEAPP